MQLIRLFFIAICLANSFARADDAAKSLTYTAGLDCADMPPNLREVFRRAFATYRELSGHVTPADADRFATLLGYAGPESTAYPLAANDEIVRSVAQQQKGLNGQEVYLDRQIVDHGGPWHAGESVNSTLASFDIIFDLKTPYVLRAGNFKSHGKVFMPGETVYKMAMNSGTSCGLLQQSADQQGRGFYLRYLKKIVALANTDAAQAAEACGSTLLFQDSAAQLGAEIKNLAKTCGIGGGSLCYCKWATLCPEANIIQAAGVNLATYFAKNTKVNSKPQCRSDFVPDTPPPASPKAPLKRAKL